MGVTSQWISQCRATGPGWSARWSACPLFIPAWLVTAVGPARWPARAISVNRSAICLLFIRHLFTFSQTFVYFFSHLFTFLSAICLVYISCLFTFNQSFVYFSSDICLLFSKLCHNDVGHFPPFFQNFSEWQWDVFLIFVKTSQNNNRTFAFLFQKVVRITVWIFSSFLWKLVRWQ